MDLCHKIQYKLIYTFINKCFSFKNYDIINLIFSYSNILEKLLINDDSNIYE